MPKLTIFTSPPPLRALGKIPGKEENVPRESTLTNAFFCPKDGGRLSSMLIKDIENTLLQNVEVMKEVTDAGIERCFANRAQALAAFLNMIEQEENEVIVIGSSLKGLIGVGNKVDEFQTKIRDLIRVY
jgi:hypothetical protein